MLGLAIREITSADFLFFWPMVKEAFSTGESYAVDSLISQSDSEAYFFPKNSKTYGAFFEGEPVGIYVLKANGAGNGGHVANAAFIVSSDAGGKGIGRKMGEHGVDMARRLGFLALQFNFVVRNNVAAVKLWTSLGFSVIGTIPEGFRHPKEGFVDVYIMYKKL